MNIESTIDLNAESISQPTRFQCRHIHRTGHRCGSPCLKREEFCYYHHLSRRPVPKAEAQERIRARKAAFALPRPEDRASIQEAIGEVLLRLAANELNPRRAGLLLYGLQIASVNLPPRQPEQNPAETVEDVVEHPELGLIAPEQDFNTRVKREKNLEEILQEAWDKECAEAAHRTPEVFPDTLAHLNQYRKPHTPGNHRPGSRRPLPHDRPSHCPSLPHNAAPSSARLLASSVGFPASPPSTGAM